MNLEECVALERAEMDALEDFTIAVPTETGAKLGVSIHRVGSSVALLCRAIPQAAALHRVLGIGIDAPASAAELDEVLAFSRESQAAVQLAPFAKPEGIGARWSDAGLVETSRWTRFGCRLELEVPEARTDLCIETAALADAAAFGQVVGEAFGLPEVAFPWIAALVGRPGWTCAVARDGARVVAGGALRVCGGTAWLGFMGTSADVRGQGAQRALLAYRLREAARQGARPASIETGSPGPEGPGPSYRNILWSGFTVAYERPNLRWAQPRA
ncbi:MAG: GNAT family N-acetyltransferase [Polyangiaceae bacterium]|nr:GNAT family N-acetyltransferase [Polyangiaceae bacterium]